MTKHSEKHVVSPEDITDAESELSEQESMVEGTIQNLKSLREELSPLDHSSTAPVFP